MICNLPVVFFGGKKTKQNKTKNSEYCDNTALVAITWGTHNHHFISKRLKKNSITNRKVKATKTCVNWLFLHWLTITSRASHTYVCGWYRLISITDANFVHEASLHHTSRKTKNTMWKDIILESKVIIIKHFSSFYC